MADQALQKREENLPAINYGDDAGAGYDNVGAGDFQIPFLAILQDNSPQVTGANDKGIDGAKAGLLFNTVTDDLMGEALFVPALTEHCFIEWKPRDAGGGFIGRHELDSEIVQKAKAAAGTKFGKLKLENGNDLVETYYVYGNLVNEDGSDQQPIVVAFTSTKIKIYKGWITKIHRFMIPAGQDGRKIRPPLFAHLVRIKTTRQQNAKGIFYNFTVSPANGDLPNSLLSPEDPRFTVAKQLGESVKLGIGKPAYEDADAGEDEVTHSEF